MNFSAARWTAVQIAAKVRVPDVTVLGEISGAIGKERGLSALQSDVRASAGSTLASFLSESGGMRARIRAFDWSKTLLGPLETWPQSLSTAVRIMLTSRYAMWMAWGPELTFFCNDAYLPTVGIKRDWVLGARSDKVWEEIWPDIGPRIEHVLKTGDATWDEGLLLFLERSGFPEETYHTFSYSPLADDDGVTIGMLCVVTEVTERVLSERRLSTLRDLGVRLAGTKTVDDVLLAVDACIAAEARDLPFALTYFADTNHERVVLASSSGIAAGHPAAPMTIDVADKSAPWPIASVLATGDAIEIDLTSLQRSIDGGPWRKPARVALVAPIAQQGQARPMGVFVAGLNPYRPLDPTYRGFLNLFVGQIAAGLAGAKSFQDERRRAEALAEIDRAKTLFFSNISHEFRTPLTLMLGPLEEILAQSDGGGAAPWRDEIGLVHRNGLRLLRLVNTLLDFSRVEAGRVQANFERADLAALTGELASNFRSAIDKAGLRLSVSAKPLRGEIFVDRDMWEKVVLNLLSNAFKFTFEGEIAVEIKPSDDGAAAEVTIRDSGIGIPADELPFVFERFRRIEGAKGRSIEGSGIGLALVQELVKQHAGSIRVESELGRGSAFTVSLPLGRGHLPAERVEQAPAQAPTSIRAQAYVDEALGWLKDGGSSDVPSSSAANDLGTAQTTGGDGKLVLLADDNADMRNYLQHLLNGAGFRVMAFGDGEAALAAIDEIKPDLVLTDVMMPKLDGFGLLAAIRARADLRETPVLLLSARAGDEAKVEGIASGADDYLTKPFSSRELLARVESNLALARLRRENTAALERKVLERTIELSAANDQLRAEALERERAQEALRQVQKMEGIGQLTGGVAHDFNNLLTVIIGNLEALQRHLRQPERDTSTMERSAQQAMRGAQRAATLTQRLLAFSRQQPLDPKPLDVNRLVSGMSDLLRRSIGEQISVETVLAGGLWYVNADPNQLEVAILNLAVNARDAMPEGGKLTIETANAHLDDGYAAPQTEVIAGQYVVIAITDNGAGMSRDTITRAFEPFFTTKDVGHGTGLGLSQVYGFVKQSGGHVKLYSELGEGTTVKIYLPRIRAAVPAQEQEQAAPVPNSSRGEVVLVVEDDPDVRAYTTGLLRELGYGVVEAGEARSALDILERDAEIKALFTDIGLPGGMNGRQLADEARRRRPDLRVLFTTGYARNAIVHDGRLDPGVQLITKPFTYVALAEKLRDILDAPAPTGRILVVEDEVLLQMLAVETLEEVGLRVDIAGSGTEALNKVRQEPHGFEAAVVDLGLPDSKDNALIFELRKLNASMPIIVASGQSGVELRRAFRHHAKITVLPKPYTTEELCAALRSVGVAAEQR